MSKHYLQLDFKSSQFTEYSKDAKDGFETITGRSGFYKAYREGVTGTLLNAGIKDSKIGKQLTLTVKDYEGDFVTMQLNLYDQKNNVDKSYAESLIRFLPNLRKGEDYRFFPYNISAETLRENDLNNGNEVREKYYDRRGVSVKTADDGVKVATLEYNKKGESDANKIPALVWAKNPMGENRPTAVSTEAKNNFLLGVLKDAVENHLKYEGKQASNNTPTAKNTSKPVVPPAPPQSNLPNMTPDQAFETVDIDQEEDYDDLPF